MTSESQKSSAEPDSPEPQPVGKPSSARRWVLSLVVLIGAAAGVFILRANGGLETAKSAMEKADYEGARTAIERYLWLNSSDTEARMLAAMAWSQDDSLLAEEAASQAVAHLEMIPDSAPNAAEARMLEGRLTFLILLQPDRAEDLFHRSLKLNPDQFDSHYLLWKLYDMTERYFDGEPFFRATYDRVPAIQKPYRLREWYLSQFSPFSACGELDAMMGFRAVDEVTNSQVAFRRLSAFAQREPESPMVAAAIAQAYLRNRQRDAALKTLEKIPNPDSVTDPWFVAALTEVLLELGQTDRAQTVFANWPAADANGYRYSRISGMVEQVARADFELAAEFYEKAVADWPGPSDWLTMHRWFRCLALQGQKEASAKVRKRSEVVEGMMELKQHQRQREALSNLDDPDGLQMVVDFYTALDRQWEAEQWQAVIDGLRKSER